MAFGKLAAFMKPSLNWFLVLIPIVVYLEHFQAQAHLWVFFASCVAIIQLAYIFPSQRVTLEVILAVVTAYLLIAFSFAAIYNIPHQLDFCSFRLPSSPFTRMLAVLEAVIGQFFMAVLVAWLVGMFIYDNIAGKR
jgi:hypothetical protein